jgi:hypothetical protein
MVSATASMPVPSGNPASAPDRQIAMPIAATRMCGYKLRRKQRFCTRAVGYPSDLFL